MDPTSLLLRLGLAAGVLCALPSCEVYDGYPAGGYPPGGYGYGGGYGDGYYGGYDGFYEYRPPYTAFATYGVGHSYYYGGRYYSHRWWDSDDYRRYCRDRDNYYRNHHGNDHRSSDHKGEPVKLVKYREGDPRRLPEGYHSPEWYKQRGYSLKTNTYKDREGDVHGRQPSSNSNRRDNGGHDNGGHDNGKRDNDRGGSGGKGDDDNRESGFSRYHHPNRDGDHKSGDSSKKK